MAIVPQWDQSELPQAQQTGPQVDIAAAGIPGEALSRLGAAGLDYAVKKAAAVEYDYNSTNIADYQETNQDKLEATKLQARQSGDYKGAAQGFIQHLDADQAARIANAPTAHSADVLKRQLKGTRDEFVRQISGYADAGEDATWNSNFQTNAQKLATGSYRNPALAETNYGLGLGIILGAQKAGIGGDKVDWAQRIHAWGVQNYGAVIRHGIDTDANGTLRDLSAGKYDFALNSSDTEGYTRMAQSAVDRNDARADAAATRGIALQARADAMADRALRRTQATNEAALLGNAVNPQGDAPPLDPAHAADLLRNQQISPEGYQAVLHAQDGRDDPTTTLHLYGALGRGELQPADVMSAVANHQISAKTGVELQRGLNEGETRGADAGVRAGFNTLKSALDGTAVDSGMDLLGEDRAQKQALWTQAQGDWTRRVLIGHEDPQAVLPDLMQRYSPKASLPTWLSQPAAGAVTDAASLGAAVQQTQARFQSGQMNPAQYQQQGALLLQYKRFFDLKAQRDAASSAARGRGTPLASSGSDSP